ncbi:MAG: ribonuclease HII [Thaumarchaeota archaeon]|nr:ribonuclease HII [Nitrososphaerota archaeon]
MYICGIDEAGRGSILGPLVIAGLLIHHSKLSQLKSLGVKDSKKLTKKSRYKLYRQIIKIADDYKIKKIPAKIVDRYVYKHNLNLLEAKYMGKTVLLLRPQITYVDSCDVNNLRFGNLVSQTSSSKVISLHKADSRLMVVAAASIIAKVNRDNTIKKLQKQYNIGSGYTSDIITYSFIKNCIKNQNIPYFVRNSWQTIYNINSTYCKNCANTIK